LQFSDRQPILRKGPGRSILRREVAKLAEHGARNVGEQESVLLFINFREF
jgi:hypothetical protein